MIQAKAETVLGDDFPGGIEVGPLGPEEFPAAVGDGPGILAASLQTLPDEGHGGPAFHKAEVGAQVPGQFQERASFLLLFV